jgi:outer membrane lipoprotein-sorting protein
MRDHELQRWTTLEADLDVAYVGPREFRARRTSRPPKLSSRRRATVQGRTVRTVYVDGDVMWNVIPQHAGKFDLGRVAKVRGEEDVERVLRSAACDLDPMFWVRNLDPETARETMQHQVTDEGKLETLYIIEGKPKDPALLAEAEKRKDLPIEPLLRITVGEDGFPRHVLVQCYCPKWDVLELTVTDYELNPDLPDDLFEFTPPEGVQVIEADPSMWK